MKLPLFTWPTLLLGAALTFSPLQVLAQEAPPAPNATDKNLPDRSGVRPLTRLAFKAIYAENDLALLKKDATAATRYWAPNFQQIDSDANINDRATAFEGLQNSAAQLPALSKVTSQIDTVRRLAAEDGSERYLIEATTTIEADLKNAAGTVRKLKAVGQTRELWISVPNPQGEAPLYQQILSIELGSQTFLDGIEIPL